jgi:hypothetical protein
MSLNYSSKRNKKILQNLSPSMKPRNTRDLPLSPLPPGRRYAFLHNDSNSPVIINDQLTQGETHRLITILKQHCSAFGYSLQDLKGISPALCTHRIPTHPNILPCRETQRRLNNAMREVVKKEVLKLLHAGIIMCHIVSGWAPCKLFLRREA